MRLTLMTDYALRLLMHLAQHPDRLCTIGEIAETFSISESHLMKITHRLGQSGWIETVRGKGGGMRLAIQPAHLSIGQLVRSMEADLAVVECLGDHNQCTLSPNCRLSSLMQGALNKFLNHLDEYSVADVLPGAKPPGRAGGGKSAPKNATREGAAHDSWLTRPVNLSRLRRGLQ